MLDQFDSQNKALITSEIDFKLQEEQSKLEIVAYQEKIKYSDTQNMEKRTFL